MAVDDLITYADATGTTVFNVDSTGDIGTGSMAGSSVTIADNAGAFAGAEVETALAELGHIAIADPGDGAAIPVTSSGSCAITTAGAETRTMAIPTRIGQMITLYFKTDGGDAVITVAAAINVAGNTIITMADANDSITLLGAQSGGGLVWRAISNDGPALS